MLVKHSSLVASFSLLLALAGCSSSTDGGDSPAPGSDDPAAQGPSQPEQQGPQPGQAPKSPAAVPITTTPPSTPPAKIPTTSPPACAGMGGTAATPIFVMAPAGVSLQNDLAPLVLGAGYQSALPPLTHPLERISGVVAVGAPQLSGAASGTGRASSSLGFASSVSDSDFASIFPVDGDGTLYRSNVNGKAPPHAWADAAATDATSLASKAGVRALSIYRAARVDLANTASLGSDERQGPDWSKAGLDEFVRFANYSRYFAYTVQIRFDSDCKRDTFLYRAGSSSIDAILPPQDNKALGKYLVEAKAQIAVGVITLGQAPAAKAVLDTTKCAVDALPECLALVHKLDELVTKVGTAPVPTTFSGAASGNNDWFFDSFAHSSKGFLAPR